jgi:predicted transcriptional regulator
VNKKQARSDAKFLFEKKGLTKADIARKLSVTPNTVSKWAKEDSWDPQPLPPEKLTPATELSKIGKQDKQTILQQVDPLLELSFDNLFSKLEEESSTRQYSGIRDYTSLVTKLMEIKGKITGETTNTELDEDSIRAKTMTEFKEMLDTLSDTGKITGNLKQVSGKSDVIDLEEFQVKEIE